MDGRKWDPGVSTQQQVTLTTMAFGEEEENPVLSILQNYQRFCLNYCLSSKYSRCKSLCFNASHPYDSLSLLVFYQLFSLASQLNLINQRDSLLEITPLGNHYYSCAAL